nr:unnamed protein product [Digitaria exilis]
MESDVDTSPRPPPPAPARACGAGHLASHTLPTSAGGRVCLSCAAALLSSAGDASTLSHHVAHVLASLSLALADPAFLAPLRAAHPRLLAAPLAAALAGAAARRDAALASQASDLAADLAAAVGAPAASELIGRIARVLSSGGSLVKHVHTLLLYSDEIRGEILFVLYKLSILNATPWDNVCDNGDVDLTAIGRSLLQLSLEVLLKTQNDAVRINRVALLLTLAKKGLFDILLLSNQSSVNCTEAEHTQTDYMPLNAYLVLFAEAVKGSLLSTNLEVQTGTLDLIYHFLSSDASVCALHQTLIDENVADYIFEVIRLSDILKSPHAHDIEKLPPFIEEASKYAISSALSHENYSMILIPHSLLLLKEGLIFCLEGSKHNISSKKDLEDNIIETCGTILLHWLESAVVDEDFNLASCQCAILSILYACSFYNGRLATDNQVLASVEEYILLNGGIFPYEINGSVMLTLLVHLYAFVRASALTFVQEEEWLPLIVKVFLHTILEASIDWQDFLEHSDDVQSFSVIGIPCHDLCRLMHFGPPSIKIIASQCLFELLTRISDQRTCLNAQLRCSLKYLKSIIAVTEGLVFSEDSRVAGNCGACLSVILGWEKFGSQEKVAIRESKWFRLIMEEFAVALTAPGLTSKSFTNQQKIAANIAVSLLRLSQVPDWLTSLFDSHLISGILANLSARNVTAEIVNLFSELMARKYLNQEHVVALHNLFQVCRRQVYEGGSKAQMSEQSVKKVVRSTDDMVALLFGLMQNQCPGSDAVQSEQQRLRRAIDLFFQESSGREQR